MAHLVVKKKDFVAAGGYGSYFKLSPEHGVKVVGLSGVQYDSEREPTVCGYKTVDDLKKSYHWKEALKEAQMLQKASAITRMVPGFIAIKVVKYKSKYFPGIFMEHIEGDMLSKKSEWTYEVRSAHIAKLRTLIGTQLGMTHNDLHQGNIMVQKIKDGVRWIILDLDERFVSFDKEAYKKALVMSSSYRSSAPKTGRPGVSSSRARSKARRRAA